MKAEAKTIFISDRKSELIERLENMTDDEFEAEKKKERAYKKKVYDNVDNVIKKMYSEYLVLFEKEDKILKRKTELQKTRSKLIAIIGLEAYKRRVKVALPNRRFEL